MFKLKVLKGCIQLFTDCEATILKKKKKTTILDND